MNIKNFIIPAIACFCCSSFFISCEEKGLMVNDNDVSYIIFAKDMTKDTTTVSFKVYNEGEVPEIPLEVSVYGKVQDKDLKFSVSVDEDRTTLPANLYELPTECLKKSGYTNLIMTMNGQEAWDKLTEFKKKGTVRQDVHCIITDIEMPLMDGHRLTKLCKSDDEIKKIPLIIFSSLVNEEMRKKGEQLGADAQLTKPEIGMLVEAIDNLIDKSVD